MRFRLELLAERSYRLLALITRLLLFLIRYSTVRSSCAYMHFLKKIHSYLLIPLISLSISALNGIVLILFYLCILMETSMLDETFDILVPIVSLTYIIVFFFLHLSMVFCSIVYCFYFLAYILISQSFQIFDIFFDHITALLILCFAIRYIIVYAYRYFKSSSSVRLLASEGVAFFLALASSSLIFIFFFIYTSVGFEMFVFNKYLLLILLTLIKLIIVSSAILYILIRIVAMYAIFRLFLVVFKYILNSVYSRVFEDTRECLNYDVTGLTIVIAFIVYFSLYSLLGPIFIADSVDFVSALSQEFYPKGCEYNWLYTFISAKLNFLYIN